MRESLSGGPVWGGLCHLSGFQCRLKHVSLPGPQEPGSDIEGLNGSRMLMTLGKHANNLNPVLNASLFLTIPRMTLL